MLVKGKQFCIQPKNIPTILLKTLYIVIIIMTIVLLSKYVYDAVYMRKLGQEDNDYVIIKNRSILQQFIKFLQSTPPDNNISENKTDKIDLKTVTEIDEIYNPSIDIDTEEGNEGCKDDVPKEDFSECGNRVADKKCCEYIWAWKYKKELMELSKCYGYGITGGFKVQNGEFPHMAALGYRRLSKNNISTKPIYDYECGGSLISELFVLTAGHCTHLGQDTEHEPKPEVVGMGSTKLSEDMKICKIQNIITHHNYTSPSIYYDIALLKLKVKVFFTKIIHPACLSTELKPMYTKVNVTGWGATSQRTRTQMSEDLLVATVDMVSRVECKSKVKPTRHFDRLRIHQICAGNMTNVDTCEGDSGGPLQVKINTPYGNIHRVIGVTSFGDFCGSGIPAVYVSVSTVITWIEKHVWPDYNHTYYEGLGI